MNERLPAGSDEPLATLVAAATAAGVDLSSAYVVGGAVRDTLLGWPVVDLDLAVEGDGHLFAHQLSEALGGRVLATHEFGTAVVVAPLAGVPDARIDVASTRAESYERPGALPTVALEPSIRVDLDRRDFTINAIAAQLNNSRAGELLDPRQGIADLRDGLVRVLHKRSFIDDPTRIFRAARYAGRYGFTIEPDTARLLAEALQEGALATISAHRVRAELELLCAEPAAGSIRLLGSLGVLSALDPDVAAHVEASSALIGRIDEAEGDDQTLQAMAWRMRFAALARPLGVDGAQHWLACLRLRTRDAAAIIEHLRICEAISETTGALADMSLVERRGLLGGYGAESLEFAELVLGDMFESEAVREYRESVGVTRLSITGHDLLAMGIERGPAVGEVLEELYDLKLAGDLPDMQDELHAAQMLIRQRATEARGEDS